MRSIFLIGMPGAGKTYWGQQLAQSHNLPFIDLDVFIEQQDGRSILEIFETIGETGFRQLETLALQTVLSEVRHNTIVACGGGTAVHDDNMKRMKQYGCTVYLRAGLPTLTERLDKEYGRRPLLTRDPFLLPTLQQMLSARSNFYEKADYILDVENLSLSYFDQIIASCIKQP